MLRDLKRSALLVGLFVIGLVTLPFLLYAGLHFKNWLIGNPRYAAELFDPMFDDFEVLESRRWHSFGAEAFDCTYAIVGLPKEIESVPPRGSARGSVHWQLVWGGENWSPTPMTPLADGTRDAVGFCARYWDAAVVSRLQTALAQPGSFVIVDGVGETVFVYSRPQRIAARIRYGD